MQKHKLFTNEDADEDDSIATWWAIFGLLQLNLHVIYKTL